MAGDIRGIVRERTEREGIFIGILTLQQQLSNEVAAANAVHQITEFHTPKGIVTEVLDNGTAVGISMCLRELILRERWESFEEKGTEFIGPHQINDFLVGEHGVSERPLQHRSTVKRTPSSEYPIGLCRQPVERESGSNLVF
jgi:hypothetical protein